MRKQAVIALIVSLAGVLAALAGLLLTAAALVFAVSALVVLASDGLTPGLWWRMAAAYVCIAAFELLCWLQRNINSEV